MERQHLGLQRASQGQGSIRQPKETEGLGESGKIMEAALRSASLSSAYYASTFIGIFFSGTFNI